MHCCIPVRCIRVARACHCIVTVGEGAGDMLQSRCSDFAPRQADSCGVSGLDMTIATSRYEELMLQGDKPHRGLHSVVGGIQGISPTEDYHQLQPGGIWSRNGHFYEELCGDNVISSSHIMMPWSTKEESLRRGKSLPWTSTQHFYRDPFGDPIPAGSLEYQ